MADTKRNAKLFMGGFLAFLMVFSIAGIIGEGIQDTAGPQPIKYEGHTLISTRNGYIVENIGPGVSWVFLPDELKEYSSIPVKLEGEKVYLTKDPVLNISIDQAQQRILSVLNAVRSRGVPACTTVHGCMADVPIKICDEQFLTLQFRYGPTALYQEDDLCYVLQAQDELEFYKLAEYLTYTTFGIL